METLEQLTEDQIEAIKKDSGKTTAGIEGYYRWTARGD